MSEIYHGPEHQPSGETPAEHQPTVEKSQSEHGKAEKQPADAEKARQVAKAEAKSSEDIKKAAGHNKDQQPKEEFVGRETKELTYQRTLLKVRRHLSPLGRATSKVIHQPVVDTVSEATGKTLARPSGLLGAGLVAFIGTSVYYYITRHYGYTYSFSVYLALLLAGLFVGWLIEVLWHLLHRSK